MSDSNQSVDVTDDLDAFSNELFGEQPAVEPKVEPEEVDDVKPSAENEDDVSEKDTTEDDALEDDQEDEPEEDEEDREPPKPKGRKPARERINELTAQKKELERRLAEVERLVQERKPAEEVKPAPKADSPVDDGPDPDDTLEDGTLKYPLGEFDPKFIKDLTRHTLQQEREEARQMDEAERAAAEIEAAEKELLDNWGKRLQESQERLPELREKAENLEETFNGLDPNYGKFLASTIMSLEYGPDVLNYLADNIDEAQKIVAAGPTMAVVHLGRLEAKFLNGDKVEKGKVSEAPTPPPIRTKGSAGRSVVPPDTDDLEAFEKQYWNTKA